jgi:flagellar FliL protein
MAEEDELEEKPKKRFSFLKLFLFVILPILLISGTVTGLYLGGLFGGDTAASAEGDGQDELASEEGDAESEQIGPAIYVSLDPAFVVNLTGGGAARFLQITVDVMTRNPMVEEHVKTHMPAIRNNLVMLFSSQTAESVSTLEGKENLRAEALKVVQEILENETGDPGIEAVYFTSFVMQ